MNVASLRSSRSSYGDPKYLSAYSNGASANVTLALPYKVLLEGYRGILDPLNDDGTPPSALGPNSTRIAPLLDVNDPVVMHLLTEIAMGDSKGYEVLSFEEVENLKKEHFVLSTRVEATKRRLALEMKLRDAAQSLIRLYTPKRTQNNAVFGVNVVVNDQPDHGRVSGRMRDTDDGAADELATSTRKCEDLAQELWRLECRAQDVRRKLLEHTAGILQLTHRGLKKNLNQADSGNNTNFQRTPENLYSNNHSAVPDFDDRSLYKTADHLDEFGGGDNQRRDARNGSASAKIDINIVRSTQQKVEMLNTRLHEMLQYNLQDSDVKPVPQISINDDDPNKALVTVQEHLDYLENSLGLIQTQGLQGRMWSSHQTEQTETQLQELNSQLRTLLKEAGSSFSQTFPPSPSASGDYLEQHIAYLSSGFNILLQRIEGLQEQKGILTTQIQQQRELNSKSDTEEDSHIADLTQQLAHMRKGLELSEREGQGLRDELALVIEQLDTARSELTLREQNRNKEQAMATNTEKEARIQVEGKISRLEDALQQATEARIQAEQNADHLQAELTAFEGEIARAQTELTVVKAELDGAYGSRAERAAEVAANPAIQKELDDLKLKNISLSQELAALQSKRASKESEENGDIHRRVEMLEKELKETIEDYEIMTKASIEFEKEREKFEGIIDDLRDRCEGLEAQLSDEHIRWMGINIDGAPETTSTMVLKNEFKKMMRDTRTENMKLLKAEQEERRKLEAVIRNLKKERTAGKSTLSRSTIAST